MALRNAYLQKYADAPSASDGGQKPAKKHKKSKKEKRLKGANVMLVDNDVVAPSRAPEGRPRKDDAFVGFPSDGTCRACAYCVCARADGATADEDNVDDAAHVVDFDRLPEEQAAEFALQLARSKADSQAQWVVERTAK